MSTITLNRKQMDQLVEFVNHFKDVQWFTLEEANDASSIIVKCSIFGNDSEPETTVEMRSTE